MIAAIYARKSTDDSDRDAEARSCERQIEGAKRDAAEQGWTVGPIFRDDAISGAEWKHRDGWNRLPAALEPRPSFTKLIVSELSRIGRDSVRTPAAVLQLEERSVEIHSYMNRGRISLADEAGEMSTMLNFLLASFERRRASARTRDAMRRRFEAGAATGPIYGYTSERNGDGYAHYVIEPVELDTVRRIFRLYDEGLGLGSIAARLNAAGIIIERETWERVQTRMTARAAAYVRSTAGRLLGRPRGGDTETAYLLSGLLKCSRCGSALTVMSPGRRRDRRAFYGCAFYHHRGRAACGNGLRIFVKALDEAIIAAVAERLEPATVAEAVRAAAADLSAGQAIARERRTLIEHELVAISGRMARLVDAIADGDGAVEPLRARLREEAKRRDTLTAELEKLDTAQPLDVEALVRAVTTRAADLRGALSRHPAQTRQILRLMLGGEQQRWRCEPFDNAEGRGYKCTAPGDYRRLGIRVLDAPTVGYLGKASLTPPSTVSVQPVVFDARSEARNSAASATSSGRMRAPRRLRLR
jgi:site-specific DNA recombinase